MDPATFLLWEVAVLPTSPLHTGLLTSNRLTSNLATTATLHACTTKQSTFEMSSSWLARCARQWMQL